MRPKYKVTAQLVSDVIDAIKAKVQRVEGQPPFWLKDHGRSRNCQSFKNGMLDIERLLENGPKPFFDHTPDFFNLVQIPYDYKPEAVCPGWLTFLNRNLENDAERSAILQEFFGYCLLADTQFQKFLLLHGEGANGKSVICAVLRGMLGSENVSTVPLEVFGERFQLNATLNKLANICPEVGEIDKVAEGHLKSFTSGDAMTFERKFKDPIVATPSAKLVIATNTLPRFMDRSEGVWRRMIVMPMTVVIREGERITGMDAVEFWATRGELPGILNWSIEGLRRLRTQKGFTSSVKCEVAKEEYRVDVNPARQFLIENYREHANGVMRTSEVYECYERFCALNGYKVMGERTFGKEISRAFPTAVRKHLGSGGVRYWAYAGICAGSEAGENADIWG